MSESFERASAIEPAGDGASGASGVFRWIVPDGWQQGRGAFGGLVVGAMIRAILGAERDATRPLRSIAADLCGPVGPGEATISVGVLRRGRGTTFLDARVTQKGEVVAHASALLAGARAVEAKSTRLEAPPSLPPWREVDVITVAPPGPTFAQHYEHRSALGAPFTPKGESAKCEGWIRERAPLPTLDAAAMAGRIDAWWPTLFSLDPRPRPVATVAFTMQLLADPSTLPADAPLAYRARMLSLGDGFFVELRELWAGDRCVAINPQTFAILA